MSTCNLNTSNLNELEVLIRQIKREVKELSETTEATLLKHDGKIAELCCYIKDNLSKSLRELFDSMQLSGELDDIITSTLLSDLNMVVKSTDSFVSPELFGAKCDGFNDDAIAINSAIKTGKRVVLSNKTYTIKTPIVIDRSITLEGCGNDSIIKCELETGSMIEVKGKISHFVIQNLQLNACDINVFGINIENPYDSCIIRNIYFDNFINSCIKAGNSKEISQSLLIDNCISYMSYDGVVDNPIYHLTKCYESNILNNKLLFRQENHGSAACLLLTNCYDANIQGNSFVCSTDSAIKIEGDSRYNRIISNTYEMLDCDYSIKLIGSSNNEIQQTMILEAGSYYNAPAKIYCENETSGLFIGMESTGGRRNISINANNGKVKDAYGNLVITQESNALLVPRYSISDHTGSTRYTLFSNSSESADYGLTISDSKRPGEQIVWCDGYFGFNKAGQKIRLVSKDGKQVKFLRLGNNGELELVNSMYD